MLATLLQAAAVLATTSKPLEKIRARDGWLVDGDGRVRLFHGFNSVRKEPPWFDDAILNKTRLKRYREWGFNVVRLGAMWSGFEPEEGRFNATYERTLENIVHRLAEHEMYVILDMHQDVASTAFASYDGFPRWLIDKFPPSPNPYPWPFRHNITGDNWADGYLTEAVSQAFQFIYNNASGSQDSMARFWTKVATVFGNRSSILGYELINEPWAGNIYSSPDLLLPGIAGSRNLVPLYDHLNAAIRTVDERTVIFYEPVTWGIFFDGKYAGSGFATVPGGASYADRSALSYHYYCWLLDPDASHEHYPPLKRAICDDLVGVRIMPAVLNDISRLGGSAFLTEFGLCAPDGNPQSIDTIECRFVLELADRYLQSWTYWDSGFFDNDTGDVDWNVARAFARVYARAIAGVPLSMKFNDTSKAFRLTFILNLTIHRPTEIVIPRMHYPNGFRVSVSSELQWTYDPDEFVLLVTPTGGKIQDASHVFVALKPKITPMERTNRTKE